MTEQKLGKYQIHEKLGEGTTSEVYRTVLKRRCWIISVRERSEHQRFSWCGIVENDPLTKMLPDRMS